MGAAPVDPEDRDRRALTVDVTSVDGAGRRVRSLRAAQLMAVAIVVVVGLALASSSLFPVERPTLPPFASGAVPSAGGLPSPVSSPGDSAAQDPAIVMTPRILGVALDVSALVASARTNAPDTIAFVSGHLRIAPRRCDAGGTASACFRLSIDGLRGVSVVADDRLLMPMRQPGGGEVLVLVPRAGRLVYLGSVVVDPAGVPRIDGLIARLVAHGPLNAGTGPTLYEADGRIIRLSHDCPETASCPPASWLLGALQPQDNDVVAIVDATVVADAPGMPSDTGWTSGPFLLRPGTDKGASWVVVAREDPATILHVVIP